MEGKAPESGVWIVEGGQWRELQDGTPVDVSRWLDVGAWSVAASQSLGEIAALPSVLSPVELDLRTQSGIGAPDEKWQTIWERETKMSRAGASGLIERLARWITPRRDAGAVLLVSNARIVWSSAVALYGAVLFCLAAFFDPPRVPGISRVSLVGVAGALLLISIASWLCGRLPRSASRPRFARASAPLVVLPAMVQTLVLAIVTVGVVRIAVWNIESLFKTLLVLLLLWGASRALGLTGRLVGSRAVGTSDALLLWPF